MLAWKSTVRSKTFSALTWNNVRQFSDQSVVVTKEIKTTLKITKKPTRPPFMKNIFSGIFDSEMLVYPELDKEGIDELKKRTDPYKKYFKDNVNPETISSLKVVPNEVNETLKNFGLFGQKIPIVYGGSDQTSIETAFISEIIAKDLNVALTLYSHNFLAVQSLLMFGSHEQKEKYLPRLASGEWIGAFCMSESGSNSDLSSILTKLVCENDQISDSDTKRYLLNGKKQWVINATNTNLFVVFAKLDTRTHTGQIVPVVRAVLVERDAPGVTVSQPQEHMGLDVCNVGEVHFQDTPVQSESFLSEFHGLEICHKVLNSGRYNIGAMTVSVLKNLMNEATDFIINRKQSNKPLIDCEQIQNRFTNIASCIYSLESMTYHTAAILDMYDSPDCDLELAIIKVFSFTEGRSCLDSIMELMGGRAFLNSHITQKYFRDFRTMEVFDGTIDFTKLFISLVGLKYAGLIKNETVKKMRFPMDNPGFVIKRMFVDRRHVKDNPKLVLNLYELLHPSLTESANELEYCVLRFEYAVTVFFNHYGGDVVNQQIDLMRLADAAVKIYAMTAVLGRASRSYCIGLRNADYEVKIAIKICYAYRKIVREQLNNVIDGLIVSDDVSCLKIGPNIFKCHGYFLEHPLNRSY